MKNSIENNRKVWDIEYSWPNDGDEWDGQAARCDQPYDAWKESLIGTFISPSVTPATTVLEIGAGHGRWSKEIADRCERLILIDLSPNCIAFCRRLFLDKENVTCLVNNGRTLEGVPDDCIDFVWSYDSFVHMTPDVIESYLAEIQRVLRQNGQAIIHHAGRRHLFLWLRFLRKFGRIGSGVYKLLTMGQFGNKDGWRSDVSGHLFRKLAMRHGLVVKDQLTHWGKNQEYGVPRFHDAISLLRILSFACLSDAQMTRFIELFERYVVPAPGI
jgi:ubiquinone/menaquinone biosynthesis C-methylase UbiE